MSEIERPGHERPGHERPGHERPGPVRHVLGTLWNGVTRVRIALSNILFLLIILFIFLAFRGQSPEPLPERAALLLNPVGSVVDQKTYVEPLALLLDDQSPQEREVLLGDMVDAILIAKDDPKITTLVMELDQMFRLGTSKSGEVAAAIAEFRETGKPVIAWSDSISQDQYLLASEADELIIHPMGGVVLEGFSNYQWYFADALDKLDVNVHVFRAGEFKSIAEPFLRNDMSEGEKAISRRWLENAWSNYTARVEARRELPEGAIDAFVDGFPEAVVNQGGDLAQTALAGKLVDKVMGRLYRRGGGCQRRGGLLRGGGFRELSAAAPARHRSDAGQASGRRDSRPRQYHGRRAAGGNHRLWHAWAADPGCGGRSGGGRHRVAR